MDAYVGVTNDASLAIKSILQIKKAFRTQMKCYDSLFQENKSLQQKICDLEKRNKELHTLQQKICYLEKRNKELHTFALVIMQNEDLKKELTQFQFQDVSTSKQYPSSPSLNENNKDVVPDVDTISKCQDTHPRCSTSPTTLNMQGPCTPKKTTPSSPSSQCLNENNKDVVPDVDTIFKCQDTHPRCPTSPTTLNTQDPKRKCTPKKATRSRKSRRISNRE